MKTLFFLSLILSCGALFALGQQDGSPSLMTGQKHETKGESAMELPDEAEQDEAERMPRETFIVSGGFEEVDLPSCDPLVLEFIRQCAFEGEETADSPESDGGAPDVRVIRIYRQIVRGYKYISCVKLADGALAVFIIHKDLSGEFSLLESFRDEEIFGYFGTFLAKK